MFGIFQQSSKWSSIEPPAYHTTATLQLIAISRVSKREHLSSVQSAPAQIRQVVLLVQLRSKPFNPVSHPTRDYDGRQFDVSRNTTCCQTRCAASIIWIAMFRWRATFWWFMFRIWIVSFIRTLLNQAFIITPIVIAIAVTIVTATAIAIAIAIDIDTTCIALPCISTCLCSVLFASWRNQLRWWERVCERAWAWVPGSMSSPHDESARLDEIR